MIRRPPRSTLFPTRRSSDLHRAVARQERAAVLVQRVRHLELATGELLICEPRPLLERSEEHTSELQSRLHLVCRLLLEKKKKPHATTNSFTRTTLYI